MYDRRRTASPALVRAVDADPRVMRGFGQGPTVGTLVRAYAFTDARRRIRPSFPGL